MTFDCNFCQKIFETERGLKKHKFNCSKVEQDKFICKFCGKELARQQTLRNHESICKTKIEKQVEEKSKVEIDAIKQLLKEKDEQIFLLKQAHEKVSKEKEQLLKEKDEQILLLKQAHEKALKEKEEHISLLKTTNYNLNNNVTSLNRNVSSLVSTVDTSYKTISTVANKSGNTINNIMNCLKPISKHDFEKLSESLIEEHDITNEKQFARFVMKNGLQNKLVKTDHSRKVITYVNEEGNPVKDPKAKDLTESIYNSTKTVFEEKVKQYEQFNDDQDRDRLDFYNNIVTVDKGSMEKFGDEIVKEATKKIKDNTHPLFIDLRERITKEASVVFNQGAFDIGYWIYENIRDKIQICRSNVNIKNKYIIIRENKEKIDNKALKEGLIYAFSVQNFSEVLLAQISKHTDENVDEIIAGCKIVYDKIVNQKDENELDNIIIGICG